MTNSDPPSVDLSQIDQHNVTSSSEIGPLPETPTIALAIQIVL